MTGAANRAITCPCCGGSIGVKAAGYTVSIACLHCGSMLDVANPDVRVISEYHRAVAQLRLPLGSRGTLFHVEWEAIGWLEREAQGYLWQEYLLFNPYAGYRWLVSSGGEWQFGQMLTARPLPSGDGYGWAGRHFASEDESATITTRKVLGEFYWRVAAGDRVEAESYASSDGQTLSMEATADEVQWTHLVPVPQSWIDAFRRPQGPDLARPEPQRVVEEPKQGFFARLARRWREADNGDGEVDLWMMGLIGVGAALLGLLMLAALGMSTARIEGQAQVPVDAGNTQFRLGTLTVSRGHQYVTVAVNAEHFVNKWVDLDYALVNKATGQAMNASATVEYYAGRDSDGDWSEGSHTSETRFSEVPAGQYDLMVQAEAHNWSASGATVSDITPAPEASPTDNPWGITGIAAPQAALPAEQVAIALALEAGGLPWGLWWTAVVLIVLPLVLIFAYRRSMTA